MEIREIKWANVVAFALAITAFVIAIRWHHAIVEFLNNMGRIGPGYSGEEQTWGLLAFGLILVLIVAVTKIALQNR